MKPRDAIIVMKSRTGISLFYSRLDLFSHSFRKYLVPDEILNGELLRDSSINIYIYIFRAGRIKKENLRSGTMVKNIRHRYGSVNKGPCFISFHSLRR